MLINGVNSNQMDPIWELIFLDSIKASTALALDVTNDMKYIIAECKHSMPLPTQYAASVVVGFVCMMGLV